MSGRPGPAGIRSHLQAACVRLIALVLRLFPAGAAARLGSLAGSIYSRVDARRFRIAIENLERAFGAGLSPARRIEIARAAFRHFGRAAFEILTMDRYRASDAGTLFTYEGLEHI